MLVLGNVDVAGLGQLVELPFDHPQGDVAQQADNLQRVLRQRHRHGLDVEVVAEQDRDVVAPAGVHREASAAQVGAVDDVVVDQRRGVNELDDRGVENGPLTLVAAEPCRHQQHGRSDALAAAVLDVATHLRDERDARLDMTDEFPFNGLEIFADRLEDLRQVGRERGVLHYVGQNGAFSRDRFTILNFIRGVSTR